MNPELLEKLASVAHNAFLDYAKQNEIPIDKSLNLPYGELGVASKLYYCALVGAVARELEKEKELLAAYGGSAWGG